MTMDQNGAGDHVQCERGTHSRAEMLNSSSFHMPLDLHLRAWNLGINMQGSFLKGFW